MLPLDYCDLRQVRIYETNGTFKIAVTLEALSLLPVVLSLWPGSDCLG